MEKTSFLSFLTVPEEQPIPQLPVVLSHLLFYPALEVNSNNAQNKKATLNDGSKLLKFQHIKDKPFILSLFLRSS